MKTTLSLLFLFACTLTMAQDKIYKTDGSKIDAKILEIQTEQIKYKLFSNLQGPDYFISRSDVLLIAYENGTSEIITQVHKNKKGDSLQTKFGKNMIGFNFFDVVFKNLTLSYEHIFPSGMIGVKIPVTVGFSDNNYENIPNSKTSSFSLEINYYPTGQGRIKYFVSPFIELGWVRYEIWNYAYYNYNEENRTFYFVGLTNGVLFQPTYHFNIAVALGLGMGEVKNERGGAYPTTKFQTNFCYRF